MVEGYFNKRIWSFRNRTSNLYLRDFVDYYLIGGMTASEQLKYLPSVGKDPLKLSRGNMLIDFSSTAILSLGGPLFDFAMGSISSYDLKFGIYSGLVAASSSVLINSSRLVYSIVTGRPVESFSPLSLVANSTTYFNKRDSLEFVLGANHEDMFDSDLKRAVRPVFVGVVNLEDEIESGVYVNELFQEKSNKV